MFAGSILRILILLLLTHIPYGKSTSIDPELNIIYATHDNVKQFVRDEDRRIHSLILSKNETLPQFVTYDARNNFAYWTDTEGIHKRLLSDDSTVETVADTGFRSPSGIAFDWITGNIYFTDLEASLIGVCNRDNSSTFCTILIQLEVDKPRGIVLHPLEGIMFWTNGGNTPKILRAGMDGSSPTEIISTGLKNPGGLAIDFETSKLYWVDLELRTIESSNFDGTYLITFANDEYVQKPFDIAIWKDRLYWSDWGTKSIKSLNKTSLSDFQSILVDQVRINGLAIADEYNQQRFNPCETANCSHICTLSPILPFQCACPVGMNLDNDTITCKDTKDHPMLVYAYKNTIKMLQLNAIGKDVFDSVTLDRVRSINALVYNRYSHSIILSDGPTERIFEYKINSKELEILIVSDLKAVKALGFDNIGQNLYLYDAGKHAVEAMSLRTEARVLINSDTRNNVHDLLIVPEHNSVYFANNGPSAGGIYKMRPNGENIAQFKLTDGGETIALSYDTQTDIIFSADKQTHEIESISSSGHAINNFKIDGHVPSDLFIYQDEIYFSDMFSHIVNVMSVTTKEKIRIRMGSFGNDSDSDQQTVHVPKMIIVNQNLSSLDDLLRDHECSPLNPENIACSHICLMTGQGKSGECRCPEGRSLDETGRACSCPKDLFTCANKNCIDFEFICDEDDDCKDGSDEVNCTSLPCPFKCEINGRCLNARDICDGMPDCPNGSDERNCNISCSEVNEFKCESGNRCIEKALKCDGGKDCPDNSDETDCDFSCPVGFFKCASSLRYCILESKICDGHFDCKDGSDEYWKNCPQTLFTKPQLNCTNGTICEDEEFQRPVGVSNTTLSSGNNRKTAQTTEGSSISKIWIFCTIAMVIILVGTIIFLSVLAHTRRNSKDVVVNLKTLF